MLPCNFDTVEPDLKPLPPDFRTFRLRAAITYDLDDGYRIVVPVGFVTDLASIPRIFWAIWPPAGQYSPAAIVHDYLYFKKRLTRKESDKVFLEAMKRLCVPWHRRTLLYMGVRAGGWLAWWRSSR